MKKSILILIPCLLLSACTTFGSNVRTVQRESNLATYLYGGNGPARPARKEPLRLPARVGVAFVPGETATSRIPEKVKTEAAEAVRGELAKHPKYVAGAQIIPSSYLRPKGGVCDLERVADQFDVDVIVLLAASQYQKFERNPLLALTDVTIIGLFTIPGTKVDTATVLEAAVYHVPSRSLVFRADGASETSSRATPYGTDGVARNDAVTSIGAAARKIVASLGQALARFENFDVATAKEVRPLAEGGAGKESPRENYWGRVREYKSSGGGAFDGAWLVITGGAVLCAARIRKQ
jgi:rhombotail lipoprotein